MKNPLWLVLLIPTLSAAAAPAPAPAPQSFPSAGLRALDASTSGGPIRLEAGDASRLTVVVLDADPALCSVTVGPEAGVLRLKAENLKKGWFSTERCRAGFAVVLPRTLAVTASAGSGEVDANGLAGPLELRAGSGTVRLHDVSGDLKARVGSGAVEGDLGSRRAEVRVGSGDVQLAWTRSPEDGEADFTTGSGSVALSFPKGTRLRTESAIGSGRLTNDLGEDPAAKFLVSVKAGSGNVAIAAASAKR